MPLSRRERRARSSEAPERGQRVELLAEPRVRRLLAVELRVDVVAERSVSGVRRARPRSSSCARVGGNVDRMTPADARVRSTCARHSCPPRAAARAEPRTDALELRLPGHAVDVALQDLALRRALLGDLGLVGRRLDEEGLVVLAGFNIVLDRVADVRVLVHGQLLLARVVVLRPLPDEVPRDGLSRQKVEHADARVAVRPLELLRREVGAELELPQREHEFIGRRRRVVELVHGKRFTVARRALHEPAAELEEERELHRRVRPRRRELPARDGLGRAAGRSRPRSPGAGACRRRSP